MFIFPFARSYPAYKWPVGEYILSPRLLCVWERACTIPPRLPLDCIPVIRITRERDERKKRKTLQYPLFRNNSYNRIPVGFNTWWNVKEKRTSNVHLSLRTLLSGIQVTRWWVYPSPSALMRVWACESYFIQRGTYPFRQEGKQKTTGSRWIQSLVEKGEMSFFSFFLCLVFSLRDQREKRRMGASVQGTKDTVVLFYFPLRLFSGRRLRNPPLGERGGQKGEWAIANESTYFSLG